MTAWIRNIPNTWANKDGWRTDIALTTLRSSGYDVAGFHLGDGTRVKIPMEEMMAVASALQTNDAKHNLKPARQAYYDKIAKYDLAPLWEVLKDIVTKEPKSRCKPGTSSRTHGGKTSRRQPGSTPPIIQPTSARI